jgi:hypothetical protein
MSIKRIEAILWRSYLNATSTAIWGQSTSQYYFELPPSDYENFLSNQAVESKDSKGNDLFALPLAPFEGTPSLPETTVNFRKLRPGVERANYWYVDRIYNDQAYPLWSKNRGPTQPFDALPNEERSKNFIVIVRDEEKMFHARWIRGADFHSLPSQIRELLASKGAGWSQL